jgi:hypothetical protein
MPPPPSTMPCSSHRTCGVAGAVASLGRASKVALRCVSVAMRSLVDASVEVVASPGLGFSAAELTAALVRWPGVRDLTLLAVSDAGVMSGAAQLQPLATASLAGLTSLTVRQVGALHALSMPCSRCMAVGFCRPCCTACHAACSSRTCQPCILPDT